MKKTNRFSNIGFAALALAVALAGCGGGAGSAGPDPQETPAPAQGPVAEPVPAYSVNTGLLSYLGETPEEIGLLLGDYEETKWYTRSLFRYGGLWFAFDGVSDSPEGALSLIACSAADLVDGLDGETAVSVLDGVFGGQGVYKANENGANEWYSGGYVTYGYDGVDIDLGCGPGMVVSDDATVLISAASSDGEGEYALERIITSPFDRLWEDLGPAEWYGSQHYRSLYFRDNGEVEYNMGMKHTGPDFLETYETYKGTFQVSLDEDSGVGYDVILFELAVDWWIWEFDEEAEDDVTLAMRERVDTSGGYRIWEEGGAMKLELLSGESLDTISMGGDPVEDYTFFPAED